MIWHSESTAAVLAQLQTDRTTGLATTECERRRAAAGHSRSRRAAAHEFGKRVLARLKSPQMIVLLAVSLLTLAFSLYRTWAGYDDSRWCEAAVLVLLALLRCLLCAAGDRRVELALTRAGALAVPHVRVWRDGACVTLPATELVVGDVIEVAAGDLLPADCRLLSSAQLRCDESSLTGDSLPVVKEADVQVAAITPLAERQNMLYAGCTVVHGDGRAVVVEIGAATEAGKSTRLRRRETADGPSVQRPLTALAGRLQVPFAVLALLLCVLALLSGVGLLRSLLTAAAFLVAALPADLPATVSPVLAGSVRRMARHGVVVRRADAVERLGQISVLCSDKTGSLTQNQMTLVRAFVGDHMVKLDDNPPPREVGTLLQLAVLCTDAAEGETTDATDAALIAFAERHKMVRNDLVAAYPRLGEIPFDHDRRRMTTVHLIEGRHVVIVKGAPETLLPLCGGVPDELRDAEDFMEAGALRVLAVAYKYIDDMPAHCFAGELEQGLTFLGLLGLSDPLHPDAEQAIADCRRAQVQPVMLTGENLATASAVAGKLGLLQTADEAICGDALAAMSDDGLYRDGTRYRVCARVSPADKVRMVKAWHKEGAVVALAGDGAADIPALQEADVGCAMLRGRADATVAAADVVLTDDRFSTLVYAVREGRTLLGRLRQLTQYWLARHLGTVLFMAGLLIGWGCLALSPVPLLWIATVTGAVATWGMSRDAADASALNGVPADRRNWHPLAGVGMGVLGAALLALCAWLAMGLGDTPAEGASMALAVWTLGQIALLGSVRSTMPVYRRRREGFTLLAGMAGVLLLLPLWLAAPVRHWLGLAALGSGEWGTVVWLLLLPCLLLELGKIGRHLVRWGRAQ